MHEQHRHIWLPIVVIPISLILVLLFAWPGRANDSQISASKDLRSIQPATLDRSEVANPGAAESLVKDTKLSATTLLSTTIRLPILLHSAPWVSPLGAEAHAPLAGTVLAQAQSLGMNWVRLHRVSWRDIQPVEGGSYDWSVLATFESELRSARSAGLTPVVIVHHSPPWATINDPFPTDCGAIQPSKLGAFAAFMQALVNRYKRPEFNVHYWELGNEPDVDPRLVEPDQVYGCWGDIDDPYYGGREYGAMLKVVTPAIRAADPNAKVLIGGLLLASPKTTDPALGKPENFLEGILQAGAGPYFDILPYHVYPSYSGADVDYDNGWTGDWSTLGGLTVGKARFLKQTLAQHGLSKPLSLNETALVCNPAWYTCAPPPANFFEAQADYLPRTFVRGLGEGLQSLIWYTLDGPGWRDGGLLDAAGNPRPSFIAYQNLIARLGRTHFQQKLDLGPAIEAYSFSSGPHFVYVAWSADIYPDTMSVPQSTFLAAYDRDGNALTPTASGSLYQFSVGFSPIYIELKSSP